MNKFKLAPFRHFKKKVFENNIKVSDFIYFIGESDILRKKTLDVNINQIITAEFKKKVNYLKNCFKKYRKLTGYGRGIAAPQVGIPDNFALIYESKKLLIIINPKITKTSEKKYLYPEICMSSSPIITKIIRPAWVEVEYLDENAILQKWAIKDHSKQGKILNRVIQHEIDHLNGILNIDRINTSKDLSFWTDPNFYKESNFEEI